MTIVKSEFALALNQVATERGITIDDVVGSIEAAILAAYKKEEGDHISEEDELDGVSVKVSRENGEASVIDAQGKDITPAGFGRIAAQTAKQVILQKIREVEKKTVLSQYESQIGTLVRGRIIRYDGYNAFADIGKIEALLPKEQQIRSEKYHVNATHLFFIREISEDKYGNSRIIISRTDPRLVEELFKKEVPEITNGTVEIKKVVREPGDRAKIAVFSSQGGVDPVGACVGQRGVRVQTVTNELGGDEKIDIIQWNEDPSLFITSALSPATIQAIEVDQNLNRAKVTVDEEQAPLAIGRNGVNVNLASKLSEYEIDIVQIKSDKPQEEEVAATPEQDAGAPDKDDSANSDEQADAPQEEDDKQETPAPKEVEVKNDDEPAPKEAEQKPDEKTDEQESPKPSEQEVDKPSEEATPDKE